MKNLPILSNLCRRVGLFYLPVLSLLAIQTTCLKAKSKGANYGEKTESADIKLALQSLADEINPYSMRAGDFVHLVHKNKFNAPTGVQEQVYAEEGLSVISRREDDQTIKYGVIRNFVQYKAGEEPLIESTENQMTIYKFDGSQSQGAEKPSFLVELYAMENVQAPTTEKVTYHNFKKEILNVHPPKKVQNRVNCGGVLNCAIKITKISFDEVYWMSDQSSKRVSRNYTMSTDVPYQAAMLSECSTSTELLSSGFTAFQRCSEVEDFQFGPP